VRESGNVDETFAKGGKIVEAEYYAPLLAHASMEPPAALAVYRDGKRKCGQLRKGHKVRGRRRASARIEEKDVTYM